MNSVKINYALQSQREREDCNGKKRYFSGEKITNNINSGRMESKDQ